MSMKMRRYEDLHGFSENGLTTLSTNHFLSRVGHGITGNYIWKLFWAKKTKIVFLSTGLVEIEVILQFPFSASHQSCWC